MQLRVSGPLDAFNFQRYIHDSPVDEPFVIDLELMSFATPFGLVGLCVLATHAARQGREVRFLTPRDQNVSNYLARARLGSTLDQIGVSHQLPHVNEHNTRGNLIELTTFRSAGDVEHLATRVHDAAVGQTPEHAGRLFSSICEAGDNVETHSGQPMGFLVAQRFDANNQLRFAVGDAGMGFASSLARLNPVDDEDALILGLQPGVSSTNDPGRGYGLAEMAESLMHIGGSIAVASGSAVRLESLQRARTIRGQVGFQGAALEGIIPLGSANQGA